MVGSSDLHGTIEEDPGQDRPLVTADLASTKVDLADLGGFIGTTPGRLSTANQSDAQKQELLREQASRSCPISIPKLRADDVKLSYRGEHIVGRSMPLDNLVVNLSILGGKVTLEPVSFGVRRGRIAGTVFLDGSADVIRGRATVDFDHVDVGRLMAATHMFGGAGAIGVAEFGACPGPVGTGAHPASIKTRKPPASRARHRINPSKAPGPASPSATNRALWQPRRFSPVAIPQPNG